MEYKRFITAIFALMFIACASASSFAGEFIAPTEKDKCPVCGMFVYKYQKWVAEITFTDGTYAAFDGPKDMFKYYFNIQKYNKHKTKEDISEVYVTEYYTAKVMKARDVYFVTGSDVYGPMGEELVPVKGEEEARTFMKDHNGKKMLTFIQLTPSDIPAMKMKHH